MVHPLSLLPFSAAPLETTETVGCVPLGVSTNVLRHEPLLRVHLRLPPPPTLDTHFGWCTAARQEPRWPEHQLRAPSHGPRAAYAAACEWLSDERRRRSSHRGALACETWRCVGSKDSTCQPPRCCRLGLSLAWHGGCVVRGDDTPTASPLRGDPGDSPRARWPGGPPRPLRDWLTARP